jgi:hypothetical protein
MSSRFNAEGLSILPCSFPQKVERRHKKKKKEKKEKNPKDEPRIFLGEWVGGDEEPSKSSSDESIKSTTTHTNKGALSSSNKCHMAKGTNSNVSDDDSDSPSFEDLLNLIHEHQKVIKKQSKEIKQLNALKDFNATVATNYEDLLCKFKLHSC